MTGHQQLNLILTNNYSGHLNSNPQTTSLGHTTVAPMDVVDG